MKLNVKSALIFLSCIFLFHAGCKDHVDSSKEKFGATYPSQVSVDKKTNAVKATNEEDKWEYLVVTFGKASFSTIEESIKNGTSKLIAFQEFANLLSGHEGINLQLKLDILGRFGWELVDTIGQIGGDQQLMLKRPRIENRIEVEQEAIKKLADILREESEKKEISIKLYLAELASKNDKNEDDAKKSLVELDSKEKRDRERNAEMMAKKDITSIFTEHQGPVLDKTRIKSTDVIVNASEDNNGNLLFEGVVNINVDATEALLIDTNKYRNSNAHKIADNYELLILEKFPIKKSGIINDFRIEIKIKINFSGQETTVAHRSIPVSIKGYKGIWSTKRNT